MDFPVEWCNLEHTPLIQLHSFTNRSLPLISLFCQSVPKCRLPKNPASPRGKPRGRSHTLLPFIQPLSFVGFGRILSAPTVWVGKLLPFSEQLSCVHFGRLRASPTELRTVYVTGRVREPTYRYKLRAALSGGTAARPDRWLLPRTRNEPRSPVSCGHL